MGRLLKSNNIFVDVYDQWMDDKQAYLDWVAFFKRQGDFESALELACGTGNLTQYLCPLSQRYVATDIDEDMLNKAQEKLASLSIEFQLADMRDFQLMERFDRIICGADSVNFNQNIKQLKKTVANIQAHLNPNGKFIFDVHHPNRLHTYREGYVETGQVDDIFFEYVLYSKRNKLIHDFYWYTASYPIVQQFIQTVFTQKQLQMVFDEKTWSLHVENEHGEIGFVDGEKWHIAAQLKETR